MPDTSGSMTLALDRVKDAAEQFLIRLLPGDTAKIGYFNDKVKVPPEPGRFSRTRSADSNPARRTRFRLSHAAV